ncbi:long-chain fatty acid transport protein [Malonomonas rubra DSM 5091]|uniref:Long-chain fatty acid transport protein n=1 Tax=Malonomonas rubra DSM 5091 TaxID=1122189 RepID=A0A1M6ETX0_MALRU|nr:outer membrane protein transport protein [Malonomonas rubra]SHI88848.1 long-chain fatty acid transport protein [Malonomonas rubra DSM 5091]
MLLRHVPARASKYLFPLLLAVVLLLCPGNSQATNGYLQQGIGAKEESLAGAVLALPQSSMSAASNPATLSATGNRLDIGLDWFRPSRHADNSDGSGWHESDGKDYLIPQLGISYRCSDSLSFGLIGYANGGMQTDWRKNFFGTTPTYSNLSQLILAPTFAYRFKENHSVGASINYIRQSFEARGLQNFAAFTPSGSTAFLTNRGEDDSEGWGVRFGYFGQLTDRVNIGAFWQPKTSMSKFSRYRELLPEQGGMDVPESYGIGVAIKLHPAVFVAADWTHIRFADVATLGNHNTIGATLLGSDNGPGFGWRNIDVIKLGISYRPTENWTLRVGWNHGNNPVPSSQTAINVLSPATITDHFACGLSWQPNQSNEISLTYWKGFGKKVIGDFAALNGADAANLKMRQENFGVAYSWLF